MPDLPEPISKQDKFLHNIADGTPDISDIEPISRQDIYLKYIAENGSSGGGSINVVQTTGTSETDVMSQNAVTKELDKLGTAAYCNTGTEVGNVPIINDNGKLDNSIIPPLAITDTFIANNENEMLNIQGAEKGDICVRTDENKTYILDETPVTRSRGISTTSLSDWIELKTPTNNINVVQTTGTSTTDVMSQKAVSEMTAIGSGASTGYPDGIAFGKNAKSINDNIAIGAGNTATTNSSVVSIGTNVIGKGSCDVLIGRQSSSVLPSQNSVILGYKSYCNEPSVVSVGGGTKNPDIATRRIINVTDPIKDQDAATKKYVDDKVASGGGGSSINVVQTTGTSETDVMSQKAVSSNTCFGESAQADSSNGIAIGYGAKTVGTNPIIATAIGLFAEATSDNAQAFGSNSISSSDNSIAIGNYAKASRLNSIAIGDRSDSSYSNSIAIGESAQTLAEYSVAIGHVSKATEEYTVSFGDSESSYTPDKTKRLVNVSDPINSQDVTTKNYVDGVVLYNNSAGTSGTITLSDNYTNYKTIKIYYTRYNNEIVNSSELNTDITNIVHLFIYSTTEPFSKMLFMTCNLIFSGSTVTLEKNIKSIIGLIAGETSITSKTDSGSILYVNKIIGYKY